MDWKKACGVIIPCLNEARTIFSVVKEAKKHAERVFVIDDGSIDGTSEEAARAGAEVIRHATPQGKGACLQEGWRRAAADGFSWVVLMDGDGQHIAEEIPSLFQEADRSSSQFVIGNRMLAPQCQTMPWVRRAVNRYMSRRLSRLAGYSVPDSQCGFRLVHLPTLLAVTIEATHFEIESEMILALSRANIRASFVPISVVYRSEKSKIHPWRDTIKWFRWLGRHRKKFATPVRESNRP